MTNEYGAPLDRNGYAPSILQDDDSYCLVCYGNGYNDPLNRHEVFGGATEVNLSGLACGAACAILGTISTARRACTRTPKRRCG